MSEAHHHNHATHRVKMFYPISPFNRFYSIIITPVIMLALVFAVLWLLGGFLHPSGVGTIPISTLTIMSAVGATFLRLLIAYMLALIVSVPLAFLAHRSARFEKILLQAFDVLQSVHVLAFFPVIVLFFVRFNFLNGAAVLILF